MSPNTELDIHDIAFIEGADFVRIREEDKLERKKTSIAYHRRQAAIAAGELSASRSSLRPPSSIPRKKKTAPQFCDCGDQSHKHTKPKQAKQTTAARPRLGLPRVRKPTFAEEHDPNEKDSGSIHDNDPVPDAPVRGTCKRVKVPVNRRPAFLRKWYRDNAEKEAHKDHRNAVLPATIDAAPVTHDAGITDRVPESGQPVTQVNPAEERSTEETSRKTANNAHETSAKDIAAATRHKAGFVLWKTHVQSEEGQEALGEM